MTSSAQPPRTKVKLVVFAKTNRLPRSNGVGCQWTPWGSWSILHPNTDASVNSACAWADTNQYAPTHAALWTIQIVVAIMPLTHAVESRSDDRRSEEHRGG